MAKSNEDNAEMCLVSGTIGVIAQFNEKDDFCVYIERFEQYCTANRITEEKIQIAMLISLVSTEVYKTLRDWCFPENPKNKSLAEIKTILKQQYSPQINVYRERIQFYRTTQTSSESIMEWFTRIKRLAINCEFNNLNEILKDKFISGMKPGLVLDKLVEEKINKKLEELVQIAITKEGAVTNATGGRIQAVFKGERTRDAKQGSQQRFGERNKLLKKESWKTKDIRQDQGGHQEKCWRCGKAHKGECRYKQYRCNKCSKIGHLQSMCKANTVKVIQNEDIETLDENHINTLILVNKLHVKIEYNNVKDIVTFYVIEQGSVCLLGRDFIHKFKVCFPVSVNSIDTNELKNNLKKEFPEVCTTKLGKYRYGQISLGLKDNATPVHQRPRTVPLALKDKIEKELQRMEAEEVITPVVSSDWSSSIVPVLKADNSVRVCGNYVVLNKHLKDIYYPLPRIEQIFAQLTGCTKFSKIDLKDAYRQFELDEESNGSEVEEDENNKIFFANIDSPVDHKRMAEETKNDAVLNQIKTLQPIMLEEIHATQPIMLEEIHATHEGVVRMKAMARTKIWFPNIDKAIEELSKSCESCLTNRQNPPKIETKST
ncbi:Integrase zinc binding domain [Popillia japonica]|uniref:RNA-directed DNA polymerase n=1 Tax=Popillia japonica TaxID=7064 RepID=A0AAW1KYW6_POPJA